VYAGRTFFRGIEQASSIAYIWSLDMPFTPQDYEQANASVQGKTASEIREMLKGGAATVPERAAAVRGGSGVRQTSESRFYSSQRAAI